MKELKLKKRIGSTVYETFEDSTGKETEEKRNARVGEVIGDEIFTPRGTWNPIPTEAKLGLGKCGEYVPDKNK